MEPPRQQALTSLAEKIGWAGAAVQTSRIPGDHYNRADRLDLILENAKKSLLLKRYTPFGGCREKKASLEFQPLSWLQASGVPVSEPVFLDRDGSLFEAPAIVTGFVEGQHILQNAEVEPWARDLARTLAAIHATPWDAAASEFLLDANREATWFLDGRQAPAFMKNHPDGELAWQTAARLFERLEPNPPRLVHIDYWPGNVLWHDGRIAAVIDWEEAAFGDPAIDVAYARMEMTLSGMPDAAEMFRLAYEREAGRPVLNLAFWELAASARPMYDPDWEQDVRQPLRRFITRALDEARWGR